MTEFSPAPRVWCDLLGRGDSHPLLQRLRARIEIYDVFSWAGRV